MSSKRPPRPKVESSGNRRYIQISSDRAGALHAYLRANGVRSAPPEPCITNIDSIELAGGLDARAVQAILDRWA